MQKVLKRINAYSWYINWKSQTSWHNYSYNPHRFPIMPPSFFYIFFLYCHPIEAPSASCVTLVCEANPKRDSGLMSSESPPWCVSQRSDLCLTMTAESWVPTGHSHTSQHVREKSWTQATGLGFFWVLPSTFYLPSFFSSLINCN